MAQEVAEAPVQAPDQDATDTVEGVERFLAKARNIGSDDDFTDPADLGRGTPGAPGPDRDGAAPGGGGNGERGRGPEGPRDPEWLTSPERGRAIVNEIVRLETTLPYADRYRLKVTDSLPDPEYLGENRIYAERDGIYLDQLYKDLQDYTRVWRRERNKRDPWNPINAYREIKRRLEAVARGETISDIVQQLTGRARDRGEPPVLPAGSLNSLFEKYKDDTNADAVEGDLATWFQEARHFGLLDRADAIFTSLYRQLAQGNIPADQAEEELEKAREHARRSIEGLWRGRRTDPRAAGLRGIAEAYSTRTYDIFQLKLVDKRYDPIEGEFRFGEDTDEEEDTETYWRPGHYPKMYEIIAKTMKQFTRAKDSFLRRITGGALGKSPDELYEYFNNFTGMFGQTASAQGIDDDYVKASRLELTGRGYTFGADYSFETYNMKSANQFLMAKALHEGPEREVALARSANGEVAPHLWKFDYDPRVILLHNPGGSRGQLLSDTVTQHYLHQEIRNILIEEGMGVVLKNYRPDAQYLTDNEEFTQLSREFNRIQLALTNGERLFELSEQDQELYLAALPVFRTEKELKANLERIGIHQRVEEFKGLYEGFDGGGAHRANFIKFGYIDQKRLPGDLRRSVTIGKVQLMLRLILQGRQGKDKKQLLGVIDKLIAENRLTDKDRRIWSDAYDQSEANFKTAFQMVGAMGEKARRGGGVFFVDRNAHIEAYQRFKDISDTQLTPEQIIFKKSGRIQIELRSGKKLEELSREDREFYQALKDHGRFVDNMPVYLGEMFVQYAENRTKIEYSDESKVWDEGSLSEFFKKNKYYIEITNKDGKTEKLVTKAAYRAYMVEKEREDAINKIKTNGFEAELKVPKLLFNTVENSLDFGDVIGLDGDQTETIDFATATDPENPLNKWLNHTYLSYQPENRHQVTNPDVLKAAKRRRIRLLRPDLVTGPDQDQYENLADIHLILDPTLNRVISLQDTDMPEGMSAQQAEILLSDAAVEASNMGHWRIVRELNAAFMDPEGNPFKMRTGYNLEDYSGIARFIIRMRQFVASNPKRFARRYAAEIANLPVNVSSMPDQWGQAGVMGAIEMFADPIEEMAEQREASQFAMTKWVDQMRIGNMLFGALVGHVDPERGFSIEGLFEKPTNNSDKLQQVQKKLTELEQNVKEKGRHYDIENEFMYAVMESFDRLWIILKLVRTMESDTRNAQGALDLEKTEVFMADGKVNPAIALDINTGSSRHTEKIFFDKYIKWLTEGQGQETYAGEKWWYKMLLEKTILDPKKEMTRADWLFNKMAR